MRRFFKNNFDLTDEDKKILKKMIENYKLKGEIEKIKEGDIITRSIRIDKNVMTQFVNYCNNNNLKQTQALNRALTDFIKNK